MGTHTSAVTQYIAAAEPFAQPILTELRGRVHNACPDVEESIKWGHPHFGYHGMLAHMASFKGHATFGFWKAPLVLGEAAQATAMGSFGRLTSVKDLPGKRAMQAMIKKAMQLNVDGVAAPRTTRSRAPRPVHVPPALADALAQSSTAQMAFDAMSVSHRREYCEWIAEAKRESTVATRVAKTVAQLLEKKSLNWKYENC